MEQPHDPDALRNAITALCALIVFALILKLGTDQAELSDLQQDTSAKHARIEKIQAEHAERLVAIYEPAIAACLNGVGFMADNVFVMCKPTQVTP